MIIFLLEILEKEKYLYYVFFVSFLVLNIDVDYYNYSEGEVFVKVFFLVAYFIIVEYFW